jgi:hypothetical protein
MIGANADVGDLGLTMVDDIAYDYISYLIQMSSVLIDEPTFLSIFTPNPLRASMRIYTIPFQTITFVFSHSAFLYISSNINDVSVSLQVS